MMISFRHAAAVAPPGSLVVTHEMHFARDVADRIMFMDGGVVVEEGPARQLIDHPREERTKQFLAHYSE